MMKEKNINCQIKSNKKENSSKKENQNTKKYSQKYVPKLKVNLSCSLKFINKKKNTKKGKSPKNSIYFEIIRKNIQKYNSTPKYKNTLIISNLINCRSSHFLAIFKDYLITDYVEEFLRRIYSLNESIERIPKLYNYYKNYLQFFCKPTFIDAYSNIIIKNFGDFHAENFYKNNIEKKNHNNKDDKNSFSNEMKNNKNYELIKTIFTKSIKNSIDNINNDNDTINKNEKINKIINVPTDSNHQESTIKYDKNVGNLISEENSLLMMINEMKDHQKKKIKESRTNMKKSLTKNRNHSIYSYKSLLIVNNNINNNIKKTFNNNKGKMSTYTNIKHNDSVKNIIYSQRVPKKLTKLKKKKIINKNEKINQKNQSVNINKNNPGSIVVNINININTNENTNGNTNTNGNKNGNIINNNYKSPKNNQNKRRFPLSPLSPLNLNVLSEKDFSKKILPLSSRRNKDNMKSLNYIKIMKKKKETDNLMVLTSTSRNKKRFDLKKIKSLNSLEMIDIKNKTNNSSNKEIFCYNKKKSPKKIKYRNINSDTSYNKGKFEFCTRYTTINKTIYSSNKNIGLNQNYTNSIKSMEKLQKAKDKKSISKRTNVIFSPLQKKILEKKYYSYKRLENVNTNS